MGEKRANAEQTSDEAEREDETNGAAGKCVRMWKVQASAGRESATPPLGLAGNGRQTRAANQPALPRQCQDAGRAAAKTT